MPQEDSQTVSLLDGESASITLDWDTVNPDDIGDYTATVDSGIDTATTSVTVDNVTHERFVEAVSPGGVATVDRSVTSDRTAVATGTGQAVVTRTASVSRGLTATGQRGAATVSRSTSGRRDVVATGTGAGVASRELVATRDALGSASGAATVVRIGTVERSLTAAGAAGTGRVTRAGSARRTVIATGSGDASVVWTSRSGWALPRTPGSSTSILITPTGLETDHDQLTLTTTVSTQVVDELTHYQDAGDLDRQTTAFGAFRRIPRDNTEPVVVRPPVDLRPPFGEREVVPVETSVDEVAPRRYQVTLTLGLEEPRAREPLQGSSTPIEVDREAVDLDSGAGTSISLTWSPEASQLGDWLVTASSETDSDTQLVAISDAPWTLSFPIATISLTSEQVGQIQRGHQEGVRTITLPLRLQTEQAAALFAVGSRVDAALVRTVPDADNIVVDTLPDSELSAVLSPPDAADVGDNDVILLGWSLSHRQTGRFPFAADLTFALSN